MANEFYALLGRMRYITRWGLMRNTFSENIQEHSHQVAVLAHALGLIRREILGLPGPDPEKCAVAALYHDASEILTGDLPTPIKYFNPAIREAYRQVEDAAAQKLLAMLPPELRPAYGPLLREEDGEIRQIVKAADKLAAYIKCREELQAGNGEFEDAARETREALERLEVPEAVWFLERFGEAFGLTLDGLQGR